MISAGDILLHDFITDISMGSKFHHGLASSNLSYCVITRQIGLLSAKPSEMRRNEDGEMSRKESLRVAVFPSTLSSHEFTSSLHSYLAVPRSWQPSLLAQVSSR